MERVFKREKYNWCDKLILWLLFPAFIFVIAVSLTSALNVDESLKICVYKIKGFLFFGMLIIAAIDVFISKRKISFLWAIMFVLSLSTYNLRGYKEYLFVVGLILILSKYNVNKILKICYNIAFPTFILILMFCFTRLVPDVGIERSEDFIRHSLGFRHPNSVADYFMMIVLIKLYLNGFKLSLSEFIFVTISTILLFYLTNSRMCVLLILLSIFIAGIYTLCSKKINKISLLFENKKVVLLITLLPIILYVISMLFVFLYQKGFKIGLLVDDLISGRLHYSSMAFEKLQIMPLGVWFDNGIYVLDNWYVGITFTYGVINSILIMILYVDLIRKLLKNKNYPLLCVVIIYLFAGIIESILIDYKYNLFVCVLSGFLNEKFLEKGEKDAIVINNYACL